MGESKLTKEEIKERVLSFLSEDRIWTVEQIWRRIMYAPGYEVSNVIHELQISGVVKNATCDGYPIGWRDIVICPLKDK